MAGKFKLVLIIGGGKVGAYLAGLLLKAGRTVRVLENRSQAYQHLLAELPAGVAVLGDGTDPSLLEQVGIANASVLAAVTGDDETNLVAASLAKFEYQIERVIVRVNNPRNAWLCTPEMGVDVALNQSDYIARLIIEEMSPGDLQTLTRLRQGSVEIVEETISPTSKVANCTVAALGLPDSCTIAAVIRGVDVIVPSGTTVLQPGDEIVAVIHSKNRGALVRALA